MRPQALVISHRGHLVEGPTVVPIPDVRVFVVGRSAECDVVLPEPTVSSAHAEVVREEASLRVRDLGSRNGTFIDRGGRLVRLGEGEAVELGPGEAFAVGPFLIAPSEWIGEGVLLTADSVAGTVFPTAPEGETVVSEPPAISEDAMRRALRALSYAMAGRGADDAWTSALAGLMDLVGTGGALLASRQGDRFIVRASRGLESTICLSHRFLETTVSRSGAWCFHRGEAMDAGLSSPSLHDLHHESRLIGVPFPGSSTRVVAVGYVEQPLASREPDLAALDLFAALSGPLLAMSLDLDREVRRREALEARLVESTHSGPNDALDSAESGVALIGESRAFRSAVEQVEKVAPSTSNILLRGPTGSGKEQLARLAHEASPRREDPFVVVNCAQIPEGLVESELFGHEKGAFTGAHASREGAFARADGGTLFLDEIGDLELTAQAKILRVIETGEVVRVGGGSRRVSVRLVAATHRDLEAMIEDGTFRDDLYFRLRVVEITLPALADRHDDILPLAHHFLSGLRRARGEPVEGISERAARALLGWKWPGNVRELRNVIERAVVLDADGLLDLDDLPHEIAGGAEAGEARRAGHAPDPGQAWLDARKEFEKSYFASVLEHHGWKVGQAAKAVGITRRTLTNKIREHGLERPGRRR